MIGTYHRVKSIPASGTGPLATLVSLLRLPGRGTPSTGRRLRFALAAAAGLLAAALAASPASAAFGFNDLDVRFQNEDGSPAIQAGSHPFAMETELDFSTKLESGKVVPDGWIKDVIADLPPGFAVDPRAVPDCSNADFLTVVNGGAGCPDDTALGVIVARSGGLKGGDPAAVYNLKPPPGIPSRLGFRVLGVNAVIDGGLRADGERNLFATVANISQAEPITGSLLTLWGNPADPAHDIDRGACFGLGSQTCPVDLPPRPFITLPRSCQGPLPTTFAIDSWQDPGALLAAGTPDPADPAWVTETVLTHDDAQPPNPLGMVGCGKLAFNPSISAQPTSKAASSPSGLDFSLDVADEGLINPSGLAAADIAKTVVTLPAGMSANPSLAEGLETCTEADLERESAFSAPGSGCPDAAKVGTVEVETPLLEGELLKGALYVATPYENPFGSLLALYVVIQNPELGVVVKQPLEVQPDPLTGRLTTVAEDMPQIPFSHFRLHFREGARSPLVTPSACGTYDGAETSPGVHNPDPVKALLYPSSGGAPIETTAAFQIITGPNSGPCPTGGLPPFKPGLLAGTVNNRAGSFSPFNLRLSRSDSEQEFTHFSIKLPPGVVGKLAGLTTCSDAAIAAATARTGPLGGHEELASPSCPASSYVGRTLAGSGVGPSLAYAPGTIYLAGPYHGAPLSFVAITAGVVGPFDIGTVVVRLALRIDPETAEVFLDATGSDPIPHIVQGIPVHLRDIRAYTDRPEFVLNPTGCEPTSTASTVLGSGLDFVSPADDNPVVVSTRFQAADCAALPFNPKLSFKLKGSTKRGGNPSLRAHVAMNGIGEAAIRYAQVTLPRSEFLDNAHIGTICTRTQFRQGTIPGENCPAASVYGHVSALTPILDGPLTGPIYLRSSEHELPDLVAALHHEQINVALVGRVDSVKGGGIRNTFEFVPDAPVTSADFIFDGAKKGLLENSRNLCTSTNKVKVLLKAHSGKRLQYKTPLRPTGCKKSKRKHKRHAQRP